MRGRVPRGPVALGVVIDDVVLLEKVCRGRAVQPHECHSTFSSSAFAPRTCMLGCRHEKKSFFMQPEAEFWGAQAWGKLESCPGLTHRLPGPDKESLEKEHRALTPTPNSTGPGCKERRAPTQPALGPDTKSGPRHRAPTERAPACRSRCSPVLKLYYQTRTIQPAFGDGHSSTKVVLPEKADQPPAGDRHSSTKVVLPEKENPAPPGTDRRSSTKAVPEKENPAGRRRRSF